MSNQIKPVNFSHIYAKLTNLMRSIYNYAMYSFSTHFTTKYITFVTLNSRNNDCVQQKKQFGKLNDFLF